MKKKAVKNKNTKNNSITQNTTRIQFARQAVRTNTAKELKS